MKRIKRIFSIVYFLACLYVMIMSILYLCGVLQDLTYVEVGLIPLMICNTANLVINIRKIRQKKEDNNTK